MPGLQSLLRHNPGVAETGHVLSGGLGKYFVSIFLSK